MLRLTLLLTLLGRRFAVILCSGTSLTPGHDVCRLLYPIQLPAMEFSLSNGLHRNLRLPTLLVAAILISVIALVACTSSDGGNTTTESSGSVAADSPYEVSTAETEEQLTVGISMYLLVDDLDDPDPAVSSRRTEEELKVILAGMNEIWSQANIRLELATVDTIAVDPAILR